MVLYEQPRYKALNNGVETLSNRELIAILLRCGNRHKSALELADEILGKVENMGEVGALTREDLIKIEGIKEAKALVLLASFEIGKRIAFSKVRKKIAIHSPDDIMQWLSQEVGFLKQEMFMVLFLNQQNQIESFEKMFIGTLTNAAVHPREIFKKALQKGCAKILCIHNHPSGDTTPSQDDIDLTSAIHECALIVSIPLVDHIIVGKNTYTSFRQKHLLD